MKYLKPNVVCEPLFNGWYAWSQLIAPHTAALHVLNFQIPVMESFIDAPDVHVSASQDPALLGGPFMHLPAEQRPQVERLLEETRTRLSSYIAMGQAIGEAHELLAEHATGSSTEALYERLPAPLRGLVEIVYDDANHSSLRFIEALLYGRGGLYDEAQQSLMLSTVEADKRSFILTTPRLEAPGKLKLNLPFRSPLVDRLFAARHQPIDADALANELQLAGDERSTFLDLFIDVPARSASDADEIEEGRVRVRYFGHACVLVQTRGLAILVDPTMSYRQEHAAQADRFTFEDLPATIDYVLLTHDHQDHVCLEFLLQLRHKIRTVVVPKAASGQLLAPSLKRVLQAAGFADVVELDELESIACGGHRITGLPFLGEHGGLAISTKLAYHLRVAGRSILCLADSKNIDSELYRRLHAELGDVDLAFVGMECDGAPMSWLYGPLLRKPLHRKLDQTRRLSASDSSEALAVVEAFRCRQAHVYAMGQEPWLGFLTTLLYDDDSLPIVESNRFVMECRARGIESERLYCKKEIHL